MHLTADLQWFTSDRSGDSGTRSEDQLRFRIVPPQHKILKQMRIVSECIKQWGTRCTPHFMVTLHRTLSGCNCRWRSHNDNACNRVNDVLKRELSIARISCLLMGQWCSGHVTFRTALAGLHFEFHYWWNDILRKFNCAIGRIDDNEWTCLFPKNFGKPKCVEERGEELAWKIGGEFTNLDSCCN